MGRPRKYAPRLNEQSKEIIEENFLKLDPEIPSEDEIVIAKTIPTYKKVMFLNGRDSGITLEFHYSSATHPLKHYKLVHGLETELPEEVIDHLESCGENFYNYRRGLDGCPQLYVSGKKYLFQFKQAKAA